MVAQLIVSSDNQQILKKIGEILSQKNISNPHPDLLYFDCDQKLGIREARKIKEFFSLKPYSLKGKVVVLEDASKLTEEAQNSLLKTLEEMPSEALFLLSSRSEADLLPTVLSRCQIIRLDLPSEQSISPQLETDIEKLIEADLSFRFEYVEKIKDRQQFLKSLVAVFRNKMIKGQRNKETIKFVKMLVQAEEWAAQNVNARAILEYLMLALPSQK